MLRPILTYFMYFLVLIGWTFYIFGSDDFSGARSISSVGNSIKNSALGVIRGAGEITEMAKNSFRPDGREGSLPSGGDSTGRTAPVIERAFHENTRGRLTTFEVLPNRFGIAVTIWPNRCLSYTIRPAHAERELVWYARAGFSGKFMPKVGNNDEVSEQMKTLAKAGHAVQMVPKAGGTRFLMTYTRKKC